MTKHRIPRLPLSVEYHDGQLLAVQRGPRREFVLTVRLDPVWNEGNDAERRIRFSNVKNFQEVALFFARLPSPRQPRDSLDEVLAIVRPGKRVVGIELASLGYVELTGAEVMEL